MYDVWGHGADSAKCAYSNIRWTADVGTPVCVSTAILDELLKQGRLSGSVSGGRQDKSVFYPDIYTRAQNQWLDSFYAQNGYLGECRGEAFMAFYRF